MPEVERERDEGEEEARGELVEAPSKKRMVMICSGNSGEGGKRGERKREREREKDSRKWPLGSHHLGHLNGFLKFKNCLKSL